MSNSTVIRTASLGAAVILMAAGYGISPSAHAADAQPPSTSRSPQALSVRSAAEVRNISALLAALRDYAANFGGKYPDSIEELVQRNIISADDFKKATTSPLATSKVPGDDYEFFQRGMGPDSPADTVLVIGKNTLAPGDLRRAVGIQGGGVVWWKRAQIDAFMKKAGTAK